MLTEGKFTYFLLHSILWWCQPFCARQCWGLDMALWSRVQPWWIYVYSVKWCRWEGNEGLCAVYIRLALPNHAPAVDLVIGQPQYGQQSMTLLPTRQCGWPREDQCPRHARARPAHLPSCTGDSKNS